MHWAVREHAPLASPSLALEGLPPCFREGKISGSYQYLVNSHCDISRVAGPRRVGRVTPAKRRDTYSSEPP